MMVAATSISEWPASDRIASEPVRTPTMAFAIVSPAEATIEPSAAFSFSLILPILFGDPVSERGKRRQCTSLPAMARAQIGPAVTVPVSSLAL
jgi:hypothetical protein